MITTFFAFFILIALAAIGIFSVAGMFTVPMLVLEKGWVFGITVFFILLTVASGEGVTK